MELTTKFAMPETLKKVFAVFRKHLALLLWTVAGFGFYLLFKLVIQNKALINQLIHFVTTPLKRGVASVCSIFNFSMAEVLLGVFGLAVILFFLTTILLLIMRKNRLEILYQRILVGVCAVVWIYNGYCLLWGVNYYGDSFSDKSGMTAPAVSAESLAATTRHYIREVNRYAPLVKRDENGLFAEEVSSIFDAAGTVYRPLELRYPFLQYHHPAPKEFHFSRLMSMVNFTGFFFPFTGEANLNVDSPACMLPSTITHELAHQRNVAPEQEANFVGIVAAMESGNDVYAYSGSLLAYVHLSNALYTADPERWAATRELISPLATVDMEANNAYWKQFEKSVVSDAAENVYNNFLKSYDQTLGTKSYGACVDLLVEDFLKNKGN